MSLLDGWIFDCYPDADGMRVWVLTPEGRHEQFLDPWLIGFHLGGPGAALERARRALDALPFQVQARPVERVELFSGRGVEVLEVRLPPGRRDGVVGRLGELGVDLYAADIHPVQAYHYDRGHFPLARCGFEVEDGVLESWELRDDPWAIDYDLPDLRVVHLSLSPSEVAGPLDPSHAPRGRLVLGYEGRAFELEGAPEEVLGTFAARLSAWDPDILTTDWGDSFLVPRLADLAERAGMTLPFSRDPLRGVAGRAARSFHAYGRTVHQGGARYFFGRWHLDMKNSFLLKETGFDGLFEISRIARIPVQRAARCTIGTSLSSMQLDAAWRGGILIPATKAQAEDFRPAGELLEADKGGLVYEPDVGWHEDVAEYDFVSMYPEIMVRRNISPETVNCSCCADNRVPGVGHHLCRRRPGLVPRVLSPILDKRFRYKVLSKSPCPRQQVYARRAQALKWCLVTCFGYLGFKNARFGKIEAHECVTAWGRELLLRAKETAEARGCRVLHGLVDAIWVKLAPGLEAETLRLAIERSAGCPVGIEGVYKWLRFCPSRQDPLSGVPGRYFGAFLDGRLKVRGLACRRRDTPLLVKEMQEELLLRLGQAAGVVACRSLRGELEAIVEGYRERLASGAVSARELAITLHLSKEPEAYGRDTLPAIAARQLARAGARLSPGETLRYVVVAAKDKFKEGRARPLELMEGGLEYDRARYLELLDRAAAELLDGILDDRQA
ncbi:MAG: hypothetical protein HY927_02715 [Elusimicrobia bacterium]|nr:hypothetical protein [Elusimicrobiota bacterium]